MRIEEQVFSAKVDLPCRVFCGPNATLELAGTATNIETGRLSLDIGVLDPPWQAVVGEFVRLELSLPVEQEPAKEKYLSVRARVATVETMEDGSQRLEVLFRRPIFRDRAESDAPREAKAAVNQWQM
jgi:hypothetical protein